MSFRRCSSMSFLFSQTMKLVMAQIAIPSQGPSPPGTTAVRGCTSNWGLDKKTRLERWQHTGVSCCVSESGIYISAMGSHPCVPGAPPAVGSTWHGCGVFWAFGEGQGAARCLQRRALGRLLMLLSPSTPCSPHTAGFQDLLILDPMGTSICRWQSPVTFHGVREVTPWKER